MVTAISLAPSASKNARPVAIAASQRGRANKANASASSTNNALSKSKREEMKEMAST